MTNSATFLVDDADVPAIRKVISHISQIGYCERRVRERVGISDLNELLWRALPIYREEQLKSRDLLDVTIDLFLLQGAITIDEADQLFDKWEQEVLIRAGILLIDEKCLALASLFPVGNILVFGDHAWPRLPQPGCTKVPYDTVMSIGTDSRWLARTTVGQLWTYVLEAVFMPSWGRLIHKEWWRWILIPAPPYVPVSTPKY